MEENSVDSRMQQRQIVGRWLEYEGELRAGVLRVLLVTAFYAAQLFNTLSAVGPSADEELFHRRVTFIAAAWLCLSLGVLVAIARHWLPVGLKYVVTTVDLLLLLAVAKLGSGADSPLVLAFGLIIVMSALRGSLPLVWYTTAGGVLSYLLLSRGASEFLRDSVVEITLIATGVIVGQLLRMIRQVMEESSLRERHAREVA